MKNGIAWEVESGHAKPFFVDTVIVEGVLEAIWVVSNISNADDSVVRVNLWHVTET